MSKKINIKTIATELGLSPGTVSRVLNGKAKEFRISEHTEKLILDYAEKHEYTPNLVAKGLQASKTFTLGLMIPDIANPFFALLAKNIERAASSSNYSILLVDAEENNEKEIDQLKIMAGRNVDGIIAAPVGISSEHFEDVGVPLVFVDRYFKETDIPYITSDNYSAVYNATKLLLSKGHQHIALIKGNESVEPVKERKNGYVEAMADQLNQDLIVGTDFSIENGYQSAMKLLQQEPKPTSIIAMSNLIGLGVLKAIKEVGLQIPDDISVVFFDDQPYASFLNPPISTIKQNITQIGELAVENILSLINDNQVKWKSKLIPTDFINRESVQTLH